MSTFKGKQGKWITTDTGTHVFIEDGQTVEDALANLKQREYYSYWEKQPIDKWGGQSSIGISRKEYEKALAEGREVEARPYGSDERDWYNKIPKDMEYRMANALNNIKFCNSQRDFMEQLKDNIWGEGVHSSNFDIIKYAFRDEIIEKYNQLIQPMRDKLNSIDIDNNYDYFNKNVNKQRVSVGFKQMLLNNFDICKDESLKSIAAANSELGLKFLENEKYDDFGNKIGTCYIPHNNSLNILEGDQDTDTVFHEMFHGVFEKYDVKNSGLKETLKEEFHKNIKAIKQYFSPEEYCKRNNIDYNSIKNEYDKAGKEFSEAEDIVNKKYNETLDQIAAGGPKTYSVYEEAHKQLRANQEYMQLEENFKKARQNFNIHTSNMRKIETRAKNELDFMYPNFADMCSGYTLNKFGFGHSQNYWREDKTNHVNEFFAEMSAIKATGSNELEFIKKWLPKSVAKYEEVIKNISENKGKALDLDL